MTPILVTGGTGTLGQAVVRALTAAGQDVRVFSRRTGGDLVTGRGLPEALADVETVVHLATTLRGARDVTATRTLVDAATDIRHLVFVSIVGIDRIPIGYYRGKLAAERIVAERPHTILRATQFHDLIKTIVSGMAKLPVMPIPRLRAQPIDVRDVATHLVELATGEPSGRAPDIGGPEVRTLADLADEYLKAVGRRRLKVGIPVPGKALREGANLVPGPPAGAITFERYLSS